MITAISAIIVFLLLILVHEFGHFLSAKAGHKRFGICTGMGPTIFKNSAAKRFVLFALPIGGFAKWRAKTRTARMKGIGNKGIL